MWKVCWSPLVKRYSNSIFPSLPRHLIFILCVAFCTQAHSGQANVAYFAGGCFWCTEAVFQQAPGVTSVVSGCMQNAETIQVTFDPTKTTYDKLLNLFWRAHNPTEVDSQAQAQKSFSKPIATEITRAGSFRPAPENHQNFCRKNPNNPYVRQIIEPKLKKTRSKETLG
jgi:peptide-methionine (S)-S-oxide reductase